MIGTGVPRLVRRIRPLWLREKLFYHLVLRFSMRSADFDAASLEFAPPVRMRLSPTDIGHQVIAATGFYELAVSRRIASLARDGGLFVDVGANFGYYSCMWASARRDNRVIAFEVVPANLAALQENIDRNALARQIAVIGEAVGNRSGEALFRFGADSQTGQGGVVEHAGAGTISVPMTTLDSRLADSDETIEVLKIDVEGADTWVLEGATQLLAAGRVRHIFFEQFPSRMDELGIGYEAAGHLLAGYGYNLAEISPGEYYAHIT